MTTEFKVGDTVRRKADAGVCPTPTPTSTLIAKKPLEHWVVSKVDKFRVYDENDYGHLVSRIEKVNQMTKFQITIPTQGFMHDVTATLDDSGVLQIQAGCFIGTLSEAKARAKGRIGYLTPLKQISEAAEALNIPTVPEKPYDFTLTKSQCDAIYTVLQNVGGNPDTTPRGEINKLYLLLENIEGIKEVGRTEGSLYFVQP